jgi:hypothetical protein
LGAPNQQQCSHTQMLCTPSWCGTLAAGYSKHSCTHTPALCTTTTGSLQAAVSVDKENQLSSELAASANVVP